MRYIFDSLVIGSGSAGLTYALRMAEHGQVGVVTKRALEDCNTRWAQGGIAAVMDPNDSFDAHIEDTIKAGDGLNDPEVVRICVEEGPARLRELMELGVSFDRHGDDPTKALHLTREGGHSARRVVHARDMTGRALMRSLRAAALAHPNITILEHRHAIDLVGKRRHGLGGDDRCLGAYVLNAATGEVDVTLGRSVLLATGGAGKVYKYTSNPDLATGDGLAMAWRLGASMANMEFFQFHPTCLFHPEVKNFLVTEACRGEGGVLRRLDGHAFMPEYHELKDLAPRDVVARAIDSELKKSGDPHVLLDMTHLPAETLEHHFPGVHGKLMSLGIDMRRQPIPVVPAAHYCCGGVHTDGHGRTSIPGLLAAGEVAHTGLHGANRLASNSILENLVMGRRAALISGEVQSSVDEALFGQVRNWEPGYATEPDEKVLISQAWKEIRSLMWNYVGIVRSNNRLRRAMSRLQVLRTEIREHYWAFKLDPDLIELRNIVTVAELIVRCALMRRESRGLHYTLDYPEHDDANFLRDSVIKRGLLS